MDQYVYNLIYQLIKYILESKQIEIVYHFRHKVSYIKQFYVILQELLRSYGQKRMYFHC